MKYDKEKGKIVCGWNMCTIDKSFNLTATKVYPTVVESIFDTPLIPRPEDLFKNGFTKNSADALLKYADFGFYNLTLGITELKKNPNTREFYFDKCIVKLKSRPMHN